MIKKIFSSLLLLVFFLITPVVVSAQNFGNSKVNVSEVFTLGEDEVVNEDLFAAGERVEILGTVNGDVYAAGGQIFVNGHITGDLLAAGGSINIAGQVDQDLRIAGGNINISGIVGKNTSIAGGNLDILPGGNLRGGLTALFGNLSVSAPVATYIKGAGGNANLSGTTGGGVEMAVGSLNIGDNTEIGGDLTYWSEKKAVISESSLVGGNVVYHETKAAPQIPAEKIKNSAAVGSKIGSFVMTLFFGLLYIWLFPGNFSHVVENIRQKTLLSFVFGFVSPFVLILACLLLVVTIIGIPLAMSLFIIYVFLVFLARIPVIYLIGKTVLSNFSNGERKVWNLLIGSVIYLILSSVQVLGGFVCLIVASLGFGAFLLSFKRGGVALEKRAGKKH